MLATGVPGMGSWVRPLNGHSSQSFIFYHSMAYKYSVLSSYRKELVDKQPLLVGFLDFHVRKLSFTGVRTLSAGSPAA